MYTRLSQLRGQFIYLYQGAFKNFYKGKLVGLDQYEVELQFYDRDGIPDGFVTLPLATLTEVQYGTDDLKLASEKATEYEAIKRNIERVFSE